MTDQKPVWHEPETREDDILFAYRDKIYYWLSQAGLVILVPLIINNFMHDRHMAALFCFLVALTFTIDIFYMRQNKRPPIPPVIVFFFIMMALVFVFQKLGYIAVMWVYPTMILFFFVLPIITANIMNIFAVIIFTAIFYYFGYEHDVSLRFFGSALLSIIFMNIALKIMLELQSKLHRATIVDELTGIYNRRYMNTCLSYAIEQHKRYKTRMSLIVLDVDHFKSINDIYGHATGDEVLIKLVELLAKSLRKVDMIFRPGGEEFIVLLPETSRDDALKVAEKLREIISNHAILEERPVTVSIGVGEMELQETVDNLLNRCDLAMYNAKKQGRNQVCLAT